VLSLHQLQQVTYLQKNAFPDVTVHLKTVSNKKDKCVILFVLEERWEAKIHTLSPSKAKIDCSSLARGCSSLATMAIAQNGAARSGELEVAVRTSVELGASGNSRWRAAASAGGAARSTTASSRQA
jgi:hypothetical protein